MKDKEVIIIERQELNGLIDKYCSCGGRGPEDNPCIACSIYHELISYYLIKD